MFSASFVDKKSTEGSCTRTKWSGITIKRGSVDHDNWVSSRSRRRDLFFWFTAVSISVKLRQLMAGRFNKRVCIRPPPWNLCTYGGVGPHARFCSLGFLSGMAFAGQGLAHVLCAEVLETLC